MTKSGFHKSYTEINHVLCSKTKQSPEITDLGEKKMCPVFIYLLNLMVPCVRKSSLLNKTCFHGNKSCFFHTHLKSLHKVFIYVPESKPSSI